MNFATLLSCRELHFAVLQISRVLARQTNELISVKCATGNTEAYNRRFWHHYKQQFPLLNFTQWCVLSGAISEDFFQQKILIFEALQLLFIYFRVRLPANLQEDDALMRYCQTNHALLARQKNLTISYLDPERGGHKPVLSINVAKKVDRCFTIVILILIEWTSESKGGFCCRHASTRTDKHNKIHPW